MLDLSKRENLKRLAPVLLMILCFSLLRTFEGGRSFLSWFVWIVMYALVFALAYCGMRLGRRLFAGGTKAALWRCLSDVVGCLGLGYLMVTTFRIGRSTPLIWALVGVSTCGVSIVAGAIRAARQTKSLDAHGTLPG